MKATKMAVSRKFSKLERKLAKSLACYVSEDDKTLSRGEFLQFVCARIDIDLASGEF